MIHAESVKQWQAETEHFIEEIRGLRQQNRDLRAALVEISSCVQLLGLDGWSDAPHVMNVITKALANSQ